MPDQMTKSIAPSRLRIAIMTVFALMFSLSIAGAQDLGAKSGAHRPMSPVPFHQVKMQDEFWAPRVEGLASNTLPHAIKNTAQAVERLRLTAEYIRNGGGPKPNPHRFVSSDLFKVMEGAALMIKAQPNAGVEKQMDEIIEVIGQAQAEDGYLYASHQTDSLRVLEMGEKPYSWVVHSHELYNMGHMYEAAAAYYQAVEIPEGDDDPSGHPFGNKARQQFYSLTQPYLEGNLRLLANECLIGEFLPVMGRAKVEMQNALTKFEQVYDMRVGQAMHNLGG